ncbi:hypothetical protein BASA62_002880 [Batrachochytrium salamandrivorans]|nr:hypothetical protein BASA62_002880 [Batrachochytrium salamandrivorans]
MYGFKSLLRLQSAGSVTLSPLHSSLIGLSHSAPAARSPFLSQTTLSMSATGVAGSSAACMFPPLVMQTMRGSKYPKYGGKRLPGYILPKQSEKTAILKKMLKMKWLRLRKGKDWDNDLQTHYMVEMTSV